MNRENQKMHTGDEKTTAKKPFFRQPVFFVVVGILIGLAVIYFGLAIFFQSHFCFGTTIDGISAGGRTAEQMETLITEEIESYTLLLQEREDASEVILGSSIGIDPVFNGEIETLLEEQNGFSWIGNLISGQEFELEKVVSFQEQQLEAVVDSLDCMQAGNQREPVNATYSAYTSEGYELVPADYGTKIERDDLIKAVSEAVLALNDELILEEAGCYVEPEIGDDNEELLALLEEMNRYVNTTITYDFEVAEEKLDGSIISEWLSVDDNFNLSVDEEAVLTFVKSLASKYNTAYKPKTLETSYGSTVTISNGPYGWRIDSAGETEQILADLSAGESLTREPLYSQTANSHGENDYGDSYVEINITAQHLYVYKEGELIIESDFVSGNVSKGWGTPSGAYIVTYTTTDAVLKGETYATPVAYWMPFNGNIGMHDLSRSAYGSDIYKTRGSHGCINLPLASAKKIYETIEKGWPVLVYTLPGSESDAVKQREVSTVVSAINAIGVVTLESETAITAARNLYDNLDSATQALVTNYTTLTEAEAALAALKATPPADATIPEIGTTINTMGDPVLDGASDTTGTDTTVQQ